MAPRRIPSATINARGYRSLRAQGRRLSSTATSHRHFAVPHGRPGGEAFGRIDDGVGVEAVMAVEVVDGAGLAEMLDTERLNTMPAHAAKPTQRRRMAVDHSDDAA